LTLQTFKSRIRQIGTRVGWFKKTADMNEKEAKWYDHLYTTSADYRCHYSQSPYYFLWAVIADRLRKSRIRRVLEIGCGSGQLARFLMDQGVEEYVGIDFSREALAIAQANNPGGRFLEADARGSAIHHKVEHDAVICTEVLEHIEDDLAVVGNFLPGRRCLCSVPNFPYESHVRHFTSAEEVAGRYQMFFRDLDVTTFISPRSLEDRFFLLDGIRNEGLPEGELAANSRNEMRQQKCDSKTSNVKTVANIS